MTPPTHFYAWGNNAVRAACKGRPCRIVARAAPTAPQSVAVEFSDGLEPRSIVTSVRALRRIAP